MNCRRRGRASKGRAIVNLLSLLPARRSRRSSRPRVHGGVRDDGDELRGSSRRRTSWSTPGRARGGIISMGLNEGAPADRDRHHHGAGRGVPLHPSGDVDPVPRGGRSSDGPRGGGGAASTSRRGTSPWGWRSARSPRGRLSDDGARVRGSARRSRSTPRSQSRGGKGGSP